MILKLKDFVEKCQLFFLNIMSMFASLIKILVLSKFNSKIPKPERNEVVVVGNGPSFKKALNDASAFFKNKDIICVNNFPANPEYELLKPTALVWLDNGYYPQKGVPLRADIKDVIDIIIAKTTWELKIFLPQLSRSAQHLKVLSEKNKNIKVYYFNYTIVKGFDWFCNFFYKRNIGMPLCQNVVVASIFMATNMAYKNIYFTGAESSFFKDILVNDDNEIYLRINHFYDKDKDGTIVKMHKMPGSKEKADMAEVLTMMVKTFSGYKVIRKYADYRKVNVYNITEGSYVDAFERKKITDLL